MSFENAETYKRGNEYTINSSKEFIDEFFGWINWREDGKDSLLDVGSGPGKAVRESIFPLLSPNFSRLVVSDISPQMVELQKEEFAGYVRVECEILDIGNEISEDLRRKLGTFDHVMSFFCLMWVTDQQKAMENIYSLLKPGGDCFHVIVRDSPIFDALTSLCEKPKWKDYFTGWQDFYAFPYAAPNNAKKKGLKFMENAGFIDTKAEMRFKYIKFECNKQKENFLRSMPNKFSKEVSAEEEEEIFQERFENFKINKPSSYLILYGKKPSEDK